MNGTAPQSSTLQPSPPPPSDRELRIAAARRVKIIRRSLITAGVVLAVAGAVYGIIAITRRPSGPLPGVEYPDQGQQHVSLGTAFSYNSNPPTSGPHYKDPALWGVYDYEVQDQVFIHNLEHGGIWISYRPGINSEVIHHLEEISKDSGKIVMAPRSANDADIALAAWGHLDKFSAAEFSEERVRAFIRAFHNRGPEGVLSMGGGIDPKTAK